MDDQEQAVLEFRELFQAWQDSRGLLDEEEEDRLVERLFQASRKLPPLRRA
jgi:16S rRNA G527 N7-methylase RsmG